MTQSRGGARQETHTGKCFHVPTSEPSCCQTVLCPPSTPGEWEGLIPTLKQERQALKSQVTGRPPQFSALWLPHLGSNPSQRKSGPRPAPDIACPLSQGPRLKKPGVGGATTQQAALSSHPHTCVGWEEVVEFPSLVLRGCPSVSWDRPPYPHPPTRKLACSGAMGKGTIRVPLSPGGGDSLRTPLQAPCPPGSC